MKTDNREHIINEKLKRMRKDESPANNLWQRISPELGIKQKSAFRNIIHFCISHKQAFAACACVLILLAATGIFYFTGGQFRNRNGLTHDFKILQEFSDAEEEYKKVKDSLLASLRKSGMQAKEIEKVENSLKQIDNAIFDIETAIINQPDNNDNRMYLADLYRQETLFLNRIMSSVKGVND